MRAILILIVCLLWHGFYSQSAYAQDLQKIISIKVEKAAIPDVLQEIQKNYNIRFSYLNNDFSGDTIYDFHLHEKPLSEVLTKLLEKSKAGFRQHNGQIIIKKGYATTPAKDERSKDEPSRQERSNESLKDESLAQRSASASVKPSTPSVLKETSKVLSQEAAVEADSIGAVSKPEDSDIGGPSSDRREAVTPQQKGGETSATTVGVDIETVEPNAASEGFTEMESGSVNGSANIPQNSRAAGNAQPDERARIKEERKTGSRLVSGITEQWEKLKGEKSDISDEEPESELKLLHAGFVYPLSNQGSGSKEYIYRYSIHTLVGYSGGLDGLEFTGVGSVMKNSMKGAQFSGAFNLVGGNVNGGQFAGALNTAGGHVAGAQFAGAVNINGKSLNGGQFAGFGNFTRGSGKGIQSAGFINIADTLHGIQMAGFQNTGRIMSGAQVAGFINTASRMDGIQIAGFINTVGYIRGSQIGILNFADSLDRGIPLGILSFVKNGYKALELYAGEDFHANINFKTGVSHFYNILALGVEADDSRRWGLGYGVGSEWNFSNSFRLNTDLISYHIFEQNYRDFPDGILDIFEMNSLNKLRVLASLQLGRKTAVFAGPTYNIAISQYKKDGESTPGSALKVGNIFYDRTFREKTNIRMWFGFNAGIRF